MIRAHQPGSEPIDIPETIPNPVVVPKPIPAPTEPAPKEPVRNTLRSDIYYSDPITVKTPQLSKSPILGVHTGTGDQDLSLPSWQTAEPVLKVPMSRRDSMVRKGRLHRLQDRPWEMPAAIEPRRWNLKRFIAKSHDLAERLVRVGEGIALANLDHRGESVGDRR